MLLVLDNCEHVIEAAAMLAMEVLRGSRGVQVLATSREPLRVEGERVHRLSTLESPPASPSLDAAKALRFPAVQLFVQRAAASISEFELTVLSREIAQLDFSQVLFNGFAPYFTSLLGARWISGCGSFAAVARR